MYNVEFINSFAYLKPLNYLIYYFKYNFAFKMIYMLYKWFYKNNLFINNIICHHITG